MPLTLNNFVAAAVVFTGATLMVCDHIVATSSRRFDPSPYDRLLIAAAANDNRAAERALAEGAALDKRWKNG